MKRLLKQPLLNSSCCCGLRFPAWVSVYNIISDLLNQYKILLRWAYLAEYLLKSLLSSSSPLSYLSCKIFVLSSLKHQDKIYCMLWFKLVIMAHGPAPACCTLQSGLWAGPCGILKAPQRCWNAMQREQQVVALVAMAGVEWAVGIGEGRTDFYLLFCRLPHSSARGSLDAILTHPWLSASAG